MSFEASKGEHRGLWSRDGTNIVYSAAVNATMDLYRTSTLPPHQAEILLANDHDNYPTDFTPDGRLLLYTQFANEKADFWLLPMNGAGKPFRLMETPFDEQEGRFSADGRWIVYSSDESGSREIYVRSFSGPSHQYRISWGGGRLPRWGPEGSSIYYLTSDERLMEVAVRLRASEFKAGKPGFVFSLPGEESEYEVLPGRQFLILQQLSHKEQPADGRVELDVFPGLRTVEAAGSSSRPSVK